MVNTRDPYSRIIRIDRVGKIMAYEEGRLNAQQVIDLFQEMIDDGTVWALQGHYGRTAQNLIENGMCHPRE